MEQEFWTNLLENPEAVRSAYSSAPSLANVKLARIECSDEGPTITLHVQIGIAPDVKPKKATSLAGNATTIAFQLLGVEGCDIRGWSNQNTGVLSIVRSGPIGRRVGFGGDSCSLSIQCGWIRIASLERYVKQHTE